MAGGAFAAYDDGRGVFGCEPLRLSLIHIYVYKRQFLTGLLDVDGTIDELQLFRECTPLLAWDVAAGIADEV